MMKILALLLLVAVFEGVRCEEEAEVDSCLLPSEVVCVHHLAELKDLPEVIIDSGPNAEVLKTACPNLVKFMQCAADYDAGCPQPERQHFGFNQVVSEYKELVDELCSQDSELHTAYLNNIDCAIKQRSRYNSCALEAKDRSQAFGSYLRSLKGETLDSHEVGACLGLNTGMACIAAVTQRNCGEEAFETLLRMVRMSNILESNCPPEFMMLIEQRYATYLQEGRESPDTENPISMFIQSE